MKKCFLPILILILPFTVFAQQEDPWLPEFLERWEQSKAYTLAIAESMPEEQFLFKPTEEMMSFAEQLMHIALVIEWHAHSRFAGLDTPFRKEEYSAEGLTKASIIEVLEEEFAKAQQLIASFNPAQLSEKGSYGKFTRTRRQFLLLLADHVSHHRGQLVPYLRLNNIQPPSYVDYQ